MLTTLADEMKFVLLCWGLLLLLPLEKVGGCGGLASSWTWTISCIAPPLSPDTGLWIIGSTESGQQPWVSGDRKARLGLWFSRLLGVKVFWWRRGLMLRQNVFRLFVLFLAWLPATTWNGGGANWKMENGKGKAAHSLQVCIPAWVRDSLPR